MGRTQEPWLVLVLVLVTLGVYSVVYWWRVAKEVDAFQGTPGHAHRPVRASVYVSTAALALLLAGLVLAGRAFSEALATGNPDAVADALLVQAGVGILLFFAGIVAALVGMVLLYVGAWRVWRAIEADERRRGVPGPLSPAMMLVFLLVPYVNLVTTWIAYWRTQRSLNDAWAAATRASEGRDPQA